MPDVRAVLPRWVPHGRGAGIAVAAGSAAAALYQFQVLRRPEVAWWYVLAAVALAAIAQLGAADLAAPPAPPASPVPVRRRVLGGVLAAIGAALWALAAWRLYGDWIGHFDFAWLSWTAAAVLLGAGLDLAWGRWPASVERRWGAPVLVALAALLAVATLYRLGNIRDFPGEAAITQIEDLQVGNFGWAYLQGYRVRWEFLSSTWLAALGIWLGGPSQLAMRVPFAAVSALKLLPFFVWMRLAVGTAGAVVASALLAWSFWDVVLSRIPNNHNALVVCIVFALLAGPVRRGRPSAYVVLGYLSAYILHEYVAYRPLAAIAVAGAVMASLRDVAAAWWVRVSRPLLTVLLLVTMVAPLFLARIGGDRFRLEYLDGWNRARAIDTYYNPVDPWSVWIAQRLQRTREAAELFLYLGDRSPVRNVPAQPPMIDPFSAALLLLGIGAVLGQVWRPLPSLAMAGLVVTVGGTLIATGNFDVARVGGAVPYVYAMVGYGAASLAATWARAWGRPGRWGAALLLGLAVAGGGWWSTRNLVTLWTSPEIKRAHRNNLAYLTIWLREHVAPGERVLGIAPGYTNVLEGHDGSWLRGGPVGGTVAWDIETALQRWQRQPGPTVLFVFAGRATSAVAAFLSSLFPELTFRIDRDPLELQGDVASVHVPAPPAELSARLARWRCQGARATYTITGPGPGEVQFEHTAVVPFISRSTWPAEIPERLYRMVQRPSGIQLRASADFLVQTAGDYRFSLELYAGTGTLHVDGKPSDTYAYAPVPLSAGLHRLEVAADFAPMAMEPGIELRWSGPDSGGVAELMPFYRLAPVDPACNAGDVGPSGPSSSILRSEPPSVLTASRLGNGELGPTSPASHALHAPGGRDT